LKTERVAIAYRLLFAYAFIRSESEQNSSHSLNRVGFAAIAARRGDKSSDVSNFDQAAAFMGLSLLIFRL
jgi:hypothetical protein